MALVTADLLQADLEAIYAALSDDKTAPGARKGVELLNELVRVLNQIYRRANGVVGSVTMADSAYADVAALIAGEATVAVNGAFRVVNATNDLTDNALATAKGSAVAAGDIFVVDSGTTVKYLGNGAGNVYFDMSGEGVDDFMSIGS